MKYLLITLLFAFPFMAYSQEWRLAGGVGYASGEMKTLKKIMLVTDACLNYEIPIGNNYYFNPGITISSLKFNYPDSGNANIFNTKFFLNIPVSIKKYFPMSRNSKGFIDFGIYGSYLFYDKKEYKNIPVDETRKLHGLGYNFGFTGSVGYKKEITHTLSFDIAITGQIDYFFKYKNDANKIKTNKKVLSFSFYKKFRK